MDTIQTWVLKRVKEAFRLCNNIYQLYHNAVVIAANELVIELCRCHENDYDFKISHADLILIKDAIQIVADKSKSYEEGTCYQRVVNNAKKLIEIF